MPKPFSLRYMTPAELEFLSREPGSWDIRLIDRKRLAQIRLSDPKSWNPPRPPKLMALGEFWDKMPIEVIHITFEVTSIAALFSLRKTTSHFKSVVEQWQPFRVIMEHGQDAIRAMLATGASNIWTAPQLCCVLFTSRCELCGEHGEILQLLKLQRCCFRCLATDRRLLAVDLTFATHPQAMNVSQNDLQKIPCLQAMQQDIFWGMKQEVPNHWLFDYTTALRYSKKNDSINNPSNAKPRRDYPPTPTILRRRAEVGKGRAAYHTLHRLNKHTDIQPPDSHPQRFLTAVYLPALTQTQALIISPQTSAIHRATKTTHVHATQCRGCRYFWNYISPHHHLTHTLYTAPELTRHLQSCIYARLWWNKLYPLHQTVDIGHCILILRGANSLGTLFPRHAVHSGTNGRVTRTLDDSNAHFEQMPLGMMHHFEMNANPYRGLYGHYDWDGFRIEGPPAGSVGANVPDADVTGDDWYGDVLLGGEVVSQASWATASLRSSFNLWSYHTRALEWRFDKAEAMLAPEFRGKREWGLDTL